jgi:hypothetical protein
VTTAESQLKTLAETGCYASEGISSLVRELESIARRWRQVGDRTPSWRGRAAAAADEVAARRSAATAENVRELDRAVRCVSQANEARARAVDAYHSLPSSTVAEPLRTTLLLGAPVALGPFGVVAGATAVAVLERGLGAVRETTAEVILDRLEADLVPCAEGLEAALEHLGLGDDAGSGRPSLSWPTRTPNRTDPWTLGFQWLLGIGPREQRFFDGDPMTEMVKNDRFYRDAMAAMLERLRNGEFADGGPETVVYSYGGLEGIGKYFRDASGILLGGDEGNVAFAFLGSHTATINVLGQNADGSWNVRVTIENSTSLQSGTRPPVIGYHDWYQETIGKAADQFSEITGIGRTTTQSIEWVERIGP